MLLGKNDVVNDLVVVALDVPVAVMANEADSLDDVVIIKVLVAD